MTNYLDTSVAVAVLEGNVSARAWFKEAVGGRGVVSSRLLQTELTGAVAKLGGEQRRFSFSFPDGRCVWALLGRLEDPVDDHRVRVRWPVGKHRALPFPQ